MTDRELMQQALEALTRIWEDGLENYPVWAHEAAIDNLRERLAQPEQEPVAWSAALEAVWGEPEQELVIDCPRCGHCCSQRTWVDLTDEEIMEPWPFENRIAFARWLGAKLKEKNT